MREGVVPTPVLHSLPHQLHPALQQQQKGLRAPFKGGAGLGVLPAAPCPRLTIDVGLLVDLRDAQQVRPLLLAAGPGLPPGQRGLEVSLWQ